MHLTSFRNKSSNQMAFPHPQPRKDHYWNRYVPNNRRVVCKCLKRTINITDYRNREDEVNPAKYGTFGGFFHDWFVTSGGINFISWLRCRGKVVGEKNLNRHSDRERHNKYDCKHQRHQPQATGPPKDCTLAVRSAPAEKPATQNHETEQQQHAIPNPYRDRLAEDEHVINDDCNQHDAGEKETGLPQHSAAKNTCSELQKPGVGDETHGDESKPGDNHRRSNPNEINLRVVNGW